MENLSGNTLSCPVKPGNVPLKLDSIITPLLDIFNMFYMRDSPLQTVDVSKAV